ncbi:hypothetical protein JCM8547_005579 [Rhodosporidiobolus lusitaniae]
MPATVALIVSSFHVGTPHHRVGNGPLTVLSPLTSSLTSLSIPHSTWTIPETDLDSFEGEIGRSFEVLRRIARAVSAAVKRGDFPVVLAGNCHSSSAVAAGLTASGELDPALLDVYWIDAHPDAQTPSDNTNGYLDAMGTAMLAGLCWNAHMSTLETHRVVPIDQIVYVGARNVPESEKKTIEGGGASVVYGGEAGVEYAKKLEEVIKDRESRGKGGKDRRALVHWDLDSLDPEQVGHANEYPEEHGLLAKDANEVLELLAGQRPTSLTIASFNPACKGSEKLTEVAVEAATRFLQRVVQQ